MSAPDVLFGLRIVDATSDHDAAVLLLAKQSGLSVDARAHRAQKGAQLLVCLTTDGEVIGFATARALFSEAEIFDLCVAVAERRRGIGRALLFRLFDRLRDEAVSEVFLEVRASNEAAQALYRQLGFSCVGTRSRYYADGEDATLFRCCLSPSV